MSSLKYKRLSDLAKTPVYATGGAACFDIFSIDSGMVSVGGSLILGTGLSFEVPKGFALFLFSRSGHGFASDVRLANCVGVIDSDYRGEVKVKLTNDGYNPFTVNAGDRICQGVLLPANQIELTEVSNLSDTERGTGGFGSTGK